MTRERRSAVVSSLARVPIRSRGRGASSATGSYGGSLTVEGTSDRHEPVPVTGGGSRRSRRLSHVGASDGAQRRSERSRRRSGLRARSRGDRGVRGTIAREHGGKTTPTLARRGRRRNRSCSKRSAEAVAGGVNHPFPRSVPRGAKDSSRCPRGESRGSEPGTNEVRVHESSYRWQKSVGRIARLSCREVARPRGKEGR